MFKVHVVCLFFTSSDLTLWFFTWEISPGLLEGKCKEDGKEGKTDLEKDLTEKERNRGWKEKGKRMIVRMMISWQWLNINNFN